MSNKVEDLFESIVEGHEDKEIEAQDPVVKNQKSKKNKETADPAQAVDDSVVVPKSALESLLERIDDLEKRLATKSFEDLGNPANAWAKKLAIERAARKKKPVKTVYTMRDNKILRVDIKSNGSYSSYIGNYKKNKKSIDPLIKAWTDEKVWVKFDDLNEFTEATIQELLLLEQEGI